MDSAVQTTNVSNQTTVTLEKTPAKGVKGQPASRDIDPDAMEGIMASTVGEIGSKQSNTDGYGLSSGVQPVTGTSTQVIPPGAHDILTKGTKYVDGSEGPGSTMKDDVIPAHPSLGSQTATESDSLLTATTTPDAQLQLEAAQFMSTRPLLPPNTRTPLHPSNGSKEKRDVATRTEEPSSKQQEEGHGGHLEDLQPLAQRERAPPEAKVVSAPAPTYMPKGVAKNPTHEQKQPIRIDTGVSQNRAPGDTPTPSTTSTPLRSAYTAMQSSPPERMTTRVSSGALRHKSVSEILGETPKPGSHHGDRTPGEKVDSGREDNLPRHANLVTSPDSVSFRPRVNSTKEREKDRSKLHTVVFAAPKTKDLTRLPESRSGESSRRTRDSEDKDYLVTLFAAQASAQNPTLNHLINSAQKTLTTDNHYIDYHESQDCRILKRIYHLQNSNRWSLRQFERGAEPDRTATHWDVLLGEMRWMRTDFREERKWKLATAKNLADWCAEWVATTPGRRVFLQVKVQKPGSRLHQLDSHVTPVSLYNTGGSVRSDTTPELIPSAEDDMSDAADEEILHVDVSAGSAPAALFSLAPDDVVFNLDKTPISDKVLSELPLYQPFVDSQYLGRSMDKTLDRAWKKPIVPVSKFAIGKMVIKEEGPIRKRSRYNYQDEDENSPESASSLHPSEQSTAVAAPEKDDVALFNPDYRHIIHRLHAAHAFRPPSEFSMPSQSFFESRQPSQWTLSEDDELRRLVREYEYNWSLISGCVASQSSFSSNAERRTPWECFERWVSFEGLPGDMARHQYFRAWNARRDAARQRLESLYLHQQQAGAGAQAIRRRSGEPAGVERRRNNKHLALVHAMSKVAKKKETILQKRQHGMTFFRPVEYKYADITFRSLTCCDAKSC